MEGESYLIFDLYEIVQKDLERFRHTHGHYLRNFYCLKVPCSSESIAVVSALANTIADGVNATLIGKGHSEYLTDGIPKYYSGLQQEDITGRTIVAVWNKYYSSANVGSEKREMPKFVKPPLLDFNFMVCAVKKKKYTSVLDFSIFTDPFDSWIWMYLSLALILVAVIAFSRLLNTPHSLKSAFLSSVAVLLSPGGSGIPRNSALFVLWMFTCTILVTLYSGNLTSEVISPAPEDTIENLHQLADHNYGLIFGHIAWYGTVKMTAESISHSDKFTPKELLILENMVRKHQIYLYERTEFLQELALSEKKVTSMTLWPMAIRNALDAADELAIDVSNSKKSEMKKCYVGKKLVKFGEVFYAFTPPGSARLGKVFRRLTGSGITYRWLTELENVWHSNRVQDRGKVKSPTNILDSNGSTCEPLDLEGKTVTIFLLWIGCICGCLVCFIFEFLKGVLCPDGAEVEIIKIEDTWFTP